MEGPGSSPGKMLGKLGPNSPYFLRQKSQDDNEAGTSEPVRPNSSDVPASLSIMQMAG